MNYIRDRDPLLAVKNLTVRYNKAPKPIIDGLSFDIAHGETLGVFGSSGCGKTTIALSIMGLIEQRGGRAEGEILYEGSELLGLSKQKLRQLRWREIAMVPQSSMSALNPVFTIRKTMEETIRAHERKRTITGSGKSAASKLSKEGGANKAGVSGDDGGKETKVNLGSEKMRDRCERLLDLARLDKPVLTSYPHQLSGGMRQRVSIALSLALNPKLLILDEATTGLDVIVEADILNTLRQIKEEQGLSLMFITHDLRLQNAFCDRRVEL